MSGQIIAEVVLFEGPYESRLRGETPHILEVVEDERIAAPD